MSLDVSAVRRGLTAVSSLLKQAKYLSAAQALRGGVQTIHSASLMRAEVEEFTRLITDGCALFGRNAEIRKLFPLDLTYIAGEEAVLLETLSELIATLESEANKDLVALSAQVAARRQASLEKGKKELDSGNLDSARHTLRELADEYPADVVLATEIGEFFLAHGQAEDAVQHLEKAANVAPTSSLLNQLGIVLRRIARFDSAEERFKQALALEIDNPTLHFNLGRLYIDQHKWKEARASAQAALALSPDFSEAEKMEKYAKKMLDAE